MQEGIKFPLGDLKVYWLTGFSQGRDFTPAFHSRRLVERDEMDFQGAPALRHEFVDHMDRTTYNLRVPYARLEAIYNAMHRALPAEGKLSRTDERMRYLHKTLTWWAFWRNQGMTTESFAERMEVNEKTVRRWLPAALRYVQKEIVSPVVVIFPETYAPIEVSG